MTISPEKRGVLNAIARECPAAFVARLRKMELRNIIDVLKERLGAILDESHPRPESVSSYVRLLIHAIEAEHRERHAEDWELAHSLFQFCAGVIDNPIFHEGAAIKLTAARKELLDVMVKVWIETRSEGFFAEYTKELLKNIDPDSADQLLKSVRHMNFDLRSYSSHRAKLEALVAATPGGVLRRKLLQALDGNRASRMTADGARRFSYVVDTLDRQPEFVIAEMLQVQNRYEFLVGLDKTILALWVTPFARLNGLGELGESVQFTKDEFGHVEANITFHSAKPAPADMKEKAEALANGCLYCGLDELAIDKRAPSFMGLGRLIVKFAEGKKEPVTLATVDLKV